MTWKVQFSGNADKFLEANRVKREEIFKLIRSAIKKFQGENINLDIKKLKGPWTGFYRIRKGRLRVILEFDFDTLSIFIEEIDWRGSAYKK